MDLDVAKRQTKVKFAITIHNANEEAKSILEKMLENVDADNPGISDLFVTASQSHSETSTTRWNMANVGSISTTLTDYNASSIEGVAVYNEPDIAVLRLVAKLGRVDPNLRICFKFEDEKDSFMGATFLMGSGEREHWWARLESIPDTEGVDKVTYYKKLRDEFICSRLEDPEY